MSIFFSRSVVNLYFLPWKLLSQVLLLTFIDCCMAACCIIISQAWINLIKSRGVLNNGTLFFRSSRWQKVLAWHPEACPSFTAMHKIPFNGVQEYTLDARGFSRLQRRNTAKRQEKPLVQPVEFFENAGPMGCRFIFPESDFDPSNSIGSRVLWLV